MLAEWRIAILLVLVLAVVASGEVNGQSIITPDSPVASGRKPCPERDWSDSPWGSPVRENHIPGGMSSGNVGRGEIYRAIDKGGVAGSNRPLQITFKPIGTYTQAARDSCVQGQVILKIRFLSDGSVGRISVKKGLPLGLTESAIASARQIRFVPELKRGKPISRTRLVGYNFTIY